ARPPLRAAGRRIDRRADRDGAHLPQLLHAGPPAARAIAVAEGRGPCHARVIERFSLDGIHCHYQPVVDLERRTVVGYEALCRGAAGSQLEPPLELFAAARRAARLNETDWACRRASLRGARQAGLRAPLKLFINVEPSALGGESPERMAGLSEDALREVDLVVEFTERAITESPAELLRSINRGRHLGGAVAYA